MLGPALNLSLFTPIYRTGRLTDARRLLHGASLCVRPCTLEFGHGTLILFQVVVQKLSCCPNWNNTCTSKIDCTCGVPVVVLILIQLLVYAFNSSPAVRSLCRTVGFPSSCMMPPKVGLVYEEREDDLTRGRVCARHVHIWSF